MQVDFGVRPEAPRLSGRGAGSLLGDGRRLLRPGLRVGVGELMGRCGRRRRKVVGGRHDAERGGATLLLRDALYSFELAPQGMENGSVMVGAGQNQSILIVGMLIAAGGFSAIEWWQQDKAAKCVCQRVLGAGVPVSCESLQEPVDPRSRVNPVAGS